MNKTKTKLMNTRSYLIYILVFFGIYTTYAQEIITPDEAIQLTLAHNYGIKIVNNSVKVAENNTRIFNSGYLPTLTGNAGGTYNLDNTEAEFSNGNTTVLNAAESSRYNASLNLNYTLFDGLGRLYNYKRLKEQYQLSELEARETIENTLLQLFSVYYSVAQLSENTTIIKETFEISKDRLTRSEYQFEYGQNTKLAILNAQVDINNDSISIVNTQQQLINTKRDLNVILGNKLPQDFNVDTTISFLIQLEKEDLWAKTKANNVSLLQAEKNISISSLDVKSNRSQYLPTIGLTGTYGWNKNNNNAAAFVAVSTNTGISGGINLTWNLFDGGGTLTRVRNAKIALENQQLQKEQILIDLERNFNNSWDDYQNKILIYELQQENIKTAENNFDRTKEKFKIGQVNSIEFRQAQLNLLNAELSRNQAKYNAKLAELVILQLSGELLNVKF
jgi:outer membrane protein TolC